jgi:hypothetical protein
MVGLLIPTQGTSFIWPSEYNVFGASSVPAIKWKWAKDDLGVAKWQRDYRMTDNLGSVIAEIRVDDAPTELLDFNFFLSFGVAPHNRIGSFPDGWLANTYERNSRLTYIGKEVDKESGLGDLGRDPSVCGSIAKNPVGLLQSIRFGRNTIGGRLISIV